MSHATTNPLSPGRGQYQQQHATRPQGISMVPRQLSSSATSAQSASDNSTGASSYAMVPPQSSYEAGYYEGMGGGGGGPASYRSPESSYENDVFDEDGTEAEKSTIDRHRERGAGMKALDLLEETVAGDLHKAQSQFRSAMTPTAGSPFYAKTAKQAATERYTAHKKEKYEAKRMVSEVKKANPQPAGIEKKLVADKALEKRAISSRKVSVTPDDIRDPETISGMKCSIDWDRQKEAERKALKLAEQTDDLII